MSQTKRSALKSLERRLRTSWGKDLSTPLGRAGVWLNYNLFDHAFLRLLWTNEEQIAPGVWRANHPGPRRLGRYRDRGIRSVLNLRGANDQSPWLIESEACARLGLKLEVAKIYARKAPRRDEVIALIDLMRRIEKPFVMHCKSGADRAGFAAVLYLNIFCDVPIEVARRQLHWRYMHLDWTATGIVDHIIDLYQARAARAPIGLEDWLRQEYDHAAARDSFARKQGRA